MHIIVQNALLLCWACHIKDSFLPWDAYTRLEYLKVALRTVISIRAGKVRKELREEIAEYSE